MFFTFLISGTLIAISSISWLGMWMGLEINLLSIIPLMSSSKNMYSSESSMKYFITQTFASMILLFSVIMILILNEFIPLKFNLNLIYMMNTALLIKMGAAPFHFWFPEVMEGLSWMNCLIMLTWQKIAPMILLLNLPMNMNFIFMIILFSLSISTFMSLNQTSLRKILTYSSINHISWMLSAMMISFSIWLIYFLIYSLINFNIILIFNLTNSFNLNQLINSLNWNKLMKMFFLLNFLSLGGLPPFIGFFPKWLLVNWLIINKFQFLSFILIVFTLIMLFIYLQVIFSTLILNFEESKIKNFKYSNFSIMFMNTVILMSLIFCTLIFNLM
uniref:NADH-ubiquinone oxidoreductase chain 2 n=1 Tax=Lymexylon navale TaxID=295949 RepID=A0A343C1M9_9CUCU|nr:NADH dehydrogenase subunit 2 [Lymexylon navale]